GCLHDAIVLTSGRIVVALSYFDDARLNGKNVCISVYSDDGGETWARSNDLPVEGGGTFTESGSAEPGIAELRSGLVVMVMRTATGSLWESFSNDGAVWTPPRPTRLVSSNAPARLLRLQDGRLALFWNNLYGEPFRDGVSYARQVLHGAVSADDGQTW